MSSKLSSESGALVLQNPCELLCAHEHQIDVKLQSLSISLRSVLKPHSDPTLQLLKGAVESLACTATIS